MDPSIRDTVQRIHDSPLQASLVLSGAGTGVVGWLLGVAGASRTVLEIVVPYSEQAFTDYLQNIPKQFVSSDTARAMAQAAYTRGLRLTPGPDSIVGVSCTAAIASDRPKRGEHRCHVGVWDAHGWRTLSLTLSKGLRDRTGEDLVVSRLILSALAEAAAIPDDIDLELTGSEQVEHRAETYHDPLAALLAGHIGSVTYEPDGSSKTDSRSAGCILSGSFDPWHDGHRKLAAVASEIVGAPATYELSVTNVDKPRLSEDAVRNRVAQFAGLAAVSVSSAHLFSDKARLFPGCTFVIGWDTMARLVDPMYYGGDPVSMILALSRIRANGCRFLVAGRLHGSEFKTLADVSVPDAFADMFSEIPESAFRADISSTGLRQATKAI